MTDYEATLKDCLAKGQVSSRVLLGRLGMIDEDSRKSSQYQDHNYLPFYYHLSKVCRPKSILNIGFGIGLPLCCFLQGCNSVENVVCFQQNSSSFYSKRIGLSNVRSVKRRSVKVGFWRGGVTDPEFQSMLSGGFDLALITERSSPDFIHEQLDVCWSALRVDGLLVLDHIASDPKSGAVFRSFCNVKNAEFVEFSTRYGTGVLRR